MDESHDQWRSQAVSRLHSAPTFPASSTNETNSPALVGRETRRGFKVVDANKQAIAYVYGHADPRDAATAKALTLYEARRIAVNIAKLPGFLCKG